MASKTAEISNEESFGASGAMNPDLLTVKFNRGRRTSVSAESFKPTEDTKDRVVIPKSSEAKLRIASATSNNLLFRNLESDQKREVVDAMFERKVKEGEAVITQGAEGDNFYVVDEGNFEVFVNGKKVVDIGPGGSFGELALMYNCPRAATVKAASDGVLWVVTNNSFRKRKMYEAFLKSVPLLSALETSEIVKVADALEPVEFEDGDTIIEQGQIGDCFYILVEGEAVVMKQDSEESEPAEMMKLTKGNYFGELALITDKPRAASVIAVGYAKCVSLDTKAFIRLLGPCMELLKRNAAAYKKYALDAQ